MDLDELAGLAHEFACSVLAPASDFADIVNAEQPIALSGTSRVGVDAWVLIFGVAMMSYPFNEGPPCACKTYQVHKHLGGRFL